MGISSKDNDNNNYNIVKDDYEEVKSYSMDNNFYSEENNRIKPKKKFGRILSYVLIGVLCTTLGGVASSIATINYMKNNSSLVQKENITGGEGKKSQNKNTTISTLGQMSVVDIAKKVGPAVVGVSTKGFPKASGLGFEFEQPEGLGSGIIFDKEGYILTNNHVIEGAKTIRVIFNNGKEVAAKLVNSDPSYDVAVIKITEKVDVPAVGEFGDSDDISIGETAVAIGNPLGKELLGSVTSGVISAVNRNIDERNKDLKLIQTDAAINPGNSGGPLVNAKGQVIGINTEKRVGNGIEGLGFAIPINQIKPKIQSLMTPKLMLGILGRTVTEDDSKYYKIPIGVFISDVIKYGPGEKAGLAPGDIILSMDGKKVTSMEELDKIKQKHKSGDEISLKVYRDKKEISLKLKLEAQ
ncbi:S1C family serine protease [Hathewaya massiliensis]|uniref:S1C family serine protease n=1 Tax=Hathewaya massiliensis TaxID=1964382 RepID=UPI001FAA6693|nr:trypsin-like peptidase domain-containing protein [Hathewaya massiliensis]